MRAERGVTAIELLVVLGVVGIIMAVAAPHMRTYVTANQVSQTASRLRLAIMTARSEAIKRNTTIDIAPKTVSSTTSWDNGWEVRISSSSAVLFDYEGTSGVTITRTDDSTCTTASTTPTASVQYRNFGRVSSSNVCFKVTASQALATATKCVAINPSGVAYYYVNPGTGQTCY